MIELTTFTTENNLIGKVVFYQYYYFDNFHLYKLSYTFSEYFGFIVIFKTVVYYYIIINVLFFNNLFITLYFKTNNQAKEKYTV